MKAPIAFFIFNRPKQTKKVFETIREAQPHKLFIVSDGPRKGISQDADKCWQTREIVSKVDWNCEVLTHFSNINMGCKHRVSSGIDWVFEQVEEAIIVEDDCLPHPSFFPYCDELLKKYKNDTRITSISGHNSHLKSKRTNNSYYFSRYHYVWGWATWRRAWKNYDLEMQLWETIRDGNWLTDVLGNASAVQQWQSIFQITYDGNIDTWDYQWQFACWIQSGLAILPNINLVSNIGFGADATHTKIPNSKLANLPTAAMPFPLQHPDFVIRNAQADKYVDNTINLLWRLKEAILQYSPTPLKM
jgi:hypothetical protein